MSLKEEDRVKRVIVTRPMIGLLYMQVCVCKDATDKEILEVSNKENKCGTTNGWCTVHRENDEDEKKHPVQCEDDKERIHLVVSC